jgi:hypothetical protein
MKRRSLNFGCLLGVICLALGIAMATGSDDTGRLKELRETISEVRKMNGPSKPGANAAEHLSQLTEKIDPKKVDDKTLDGMVSLRDTSNDFVRAWVAVALGNLGPRAKVAVPPL